jgi:hypothetical protein
VQLVVELADRAAKAAAAAEQLACGPQLNRVLAASKLPAEAVEPDGAIEGAELHPESRVELMEVPAQPLPAAAAFVDEIVAVVDQ